MTLTPVRPMVSRLPWRYTVRQVAWGLIDLIFPPTCGGCGKAGQRFCSVCHTSLTYLPSSICEQCGYPLRPTETGRCAACRRPGKPALEAVRSIAFFEGPLQNALHRLKYRRDLSLADTFAQHLSHAWPKLNFLADRVAPVPLSAKRLRERGYNQAALLARSFAELTSLAYTPRAVARTRHTNTQVGLSAQARQTNVAGAFTADPHLTRDHAFVLLDDVCTTGATLEACAEALRAAGATHVWGLTVARARRAVETRPTTVAHRPHLNN